MAHRLATVLIGSLVGSSALQGALSLGVTLAMLRAQLVARPFISAAERRALVRASKVQHHAKRGSIEASMKEQGLDSSSHVTANDQLQAWLLAKQAAVLVVGLLNLTGVAPEGVISALLLSLVGAGVAALFVQAAREAREARKEEAREKKEAGGREANSLALSRSPMQRAVEMVGAEDI